MFAKTYGFALLKKSLSAPKDMIKKLSIIVSIWQSYPIKEVIFYLVCVFSTLVSYSHTSCFKDELTLDIY